MRLVPNAWAGDETTRQRGKLRLTLVGQVAAATCGMAIYVARAEATALTAEIIAFLDYASGEAWESQPWQRGDDYDD